MCQMCDRTLHYDGRMRARSLPASLLIGFSVLIAAGCSTTPASRGNAYRQFTPLSSAQADRIAIHALGLVGTPYRYGGNTVDGGFDCSGLINFVYRSSTGVTPPRTVAELSGFGEPIGIGELRTGDIVLFGRGRPVHAGIYVGDGRFVHAPSSGGEVRLDRLAASYWSKQPLAARRP